MRSRGRLRGVLALLGPAFVASVAYIDPGNFATNFTAGAKFGYALAWVIVLANLMAMLVQYLSAKVGVATGRDLPELCRAYLPRPVSGGLWVQAELIAMATDLAEFVGAALGLNLLFHVPLRAAGPLTAVVAFAILALTSGVSGSSSWPSAACSASSSWASRTTSRRFSWTRPRWPADWCRGSPAPAARCWWPASSGPPSCRMWSTCTPR